MNQRTRQVALILAVLLTFGMTFTAFAQDEGGSIQAVACDAPGQLTIRVWDEAWGEVIQASIDEYVTDYCPDAEVTVEIVPWGQYWDLLRTNAIAGDLPDVFNVSQDRFFFYGENGATLDLQPYYDAAGVDTTLWGSGMVDPYRWGDEGHLHAGPVNWDTVVIYYNKDLFDAAGVEYPTNEWTWDDFAAAAEALTDAENDVYGAAVYSEYQAGYPNFIASAGVEPIVNAARTQCTLAEPASVETLTFLKGLYDAGYMPSVSVLGGSSATDSFNFWLAGRVAMVTNGSWNINTATEGATFNWDVVQLPRHPETERSSSILHAVGYAASANTANPDLAANFIIYLVSDQGQRYFAEAGGVAPANPSQQDAWIASFGETDVNIQAFVDAIQDSQGVTPFEQIWEVGNTELVLNIFDLNLSVEDAVAQACEVIDAELANQ